MPGIDTAAPERTDTSSGLSPSPKCLPVAASSRCERVLDLRLEAVGELVALEVAEAEAAGDGEAGRDRDADGGHLGEAGALAAEDVLHGGGAVGAPLAEEVDQGLGVGAAHAGRGDERGGVPELHQLVRDRRGVLAGEAGVAVLVALAGGAQHAVEREVAQRVHAEELADLLDRVRRRDELLAGRRVDAVVTGPGDRRRAQPEVHLARARGPDHLHQALAGVAANQAVVHHHHRLALDDLAHRVELDLHLGDAEGLRRVDEGPADVVVPDQPVLQLDPGHLGEAERHGVGAVGHAEHHLARRAPAARGPAGGPARGGRGRPTRRRRCCRAGRSTPARRRSGSPGRGDSRGSSVTWPSSIRTNSPGLQLAGDVRADQVERAGLRGDAPSRCPAGPSPAAGSPGCPPRRRASGRP